MTEITKNYIYPHESLEDVLEALLFGSWRRDFIKKICIYKSDDDLKVSVTFMLEQHKG